MKRSKNIKLILLASASLTISACENSESKVYKNVDDCLKDTNDAEFCEKTYKTAKEEYENQFKINSLASCEQQYGQNNCYQHSSGFAPFMAGFLVSRIFSNNSFASTGLFSQNGKTYNASCHDADRQNCMINLPSSGSHAVFVPATYNHNVSSYGRTVEVSTTSVARSGFGESFSAHASSSAGE